MFGCVVPLTANAATYGDLEYRLIKSNIEVEIIESPMAYGAVVVPATIESKPVTSIGSSAFAENTYVTSIQLPSGITNIGSEAFNWCLNLKTINLPDTITSIGYAAFSGCRELTDIKWPTGCKSIPESCFVDSGLERIQIPATVQTIVGNPFDATAIQEISIDSASQYFVIDNKTLLNKDKTRLIFHYGHPLWGNNKQETELYKQLRQFIGNDPRKNDNNAYDQIVYDFCAANISLIQYTIPATVQEIGEIAFRSQLIATTIPNGVKKLGDGALWGVFLGDCTIPASVEEINGSFYNSYVKSFTVSPSNPNFSSVDGMLFNKAQTILLSYPSFSPRTHLEFPNTLQGINYAAFTDSFYTNVETLTIPQQVDNIASSDWWGIVRLDVKNYIVDSANTYYTAVDGVVFSKDLKILARYPAGRTDKTYIIPDGTTSIGSNAFYNTWPLEEVVIPNTVTRLEDDCFWRASLRSITIPSNVSYIGRYAIDTYRMSNITIPSAVTTMGDWAITSKGKSFYLNGNGMWEMEDIPLVLVYCYSGSVAFDYAKQFGHPYILIDGSKTVTNTATGISVEYNIGAYPANNVELRVEQSNDPTISQWITDRLNPTNKLLFNIDVYVNGVVQQPNDINNNGNVIVRIPLPEGFNEYNTAVYRVITENPLRLENMKAIVDNGYLVFAVDHFSYYAVVENRPQSATVNLTALNTKIAEAEGKVNNTAYTEASRATLQNALNNAKAVANNPAATQAQVDAALATLTNAINALQQNQQTNTKSYFKLWGKQTTWEKTFLNWILLIFCFGWIWMAF